MEKSVKPLVNIKDIMDKGKSAKQFAEKNEWLEKILLDSWIYGLKTRACCGHSNYITYEFDNMNEKLGGVLNALACDDVKISLSQFHIPDNPVNYTNYAFKEPARDVFKLTIYDKSKGKENKDFFKKFLPLLKKKLSLKDELIKTSPLHKELVQNYFSKPLLSDFEGLANFTFDFEGKNIFFSSTFSNKRVKIEDFDTKTISALNKNIKNHKNFLHHCEKGEKSKAKDDLIMTE